MLNEETELFCREKLAEKAALIDNVSLVVAEPAFFLSKADFAAQNGITKKENTHAQNDEALKNLLCDFVMVFYGRFDNTKKGVGTCPVMLVTYDILVFQEFKPGSESETQAHNRHAGAVMQIMNKFLKGHVLRVEPSLIRHRQLEQVGRTARNKTVEQLPGVRGFYTNLSCRVEVN